MFQRFIYTWDLLHDCDYLYVQEWDVHPFFSIANAIAIPIHRLIV